MLAQRTVEGFGLTPCVYCGLAADSRDHFVPLSYRSMIHQWRKQKGFEDVPNTVPSCRQCNSTAGASVFLTVEDKRNYIKDCYRAKYARLLKAPFWKQSEMEELAFSLRTVIEKKESDRLILIKRLYWPYCIENDVEAITFHSTSGSDPSTALNELRRHQILA